MNTQLSNVRLSGSGLPQLLTIALGLSLLSCGDEVPPSADLRGDSGNPPVVDDSGEPNLCARPSAGCECPEEGQQITCRPDLDECRIGIRSCHGGVWSECVEVDYDNDSKEGIGSNAQGLQERIGVLDDQDGTNDFDACELCQPECVLERDYDFADPSSSLTVCGSNHRTPKPRESHPFATRTPNEGCYQQVTDVTIDPTRGTDGAIVVSDPLAISGSLSRLYEGCHLGAWPYTDWGDFSWQGFTPDDSYATLEVRTGDTVAEALADTPTTFGGSPMTPLGGTINIGDGLAQDGKINGKRYLHVTLILNVSSGGTSPEVYEFSQKFYCQDEAGNLDPGLCSNGSQDPGETNADCGGICGPTCAPGKSCVSDLDCDSAVCELAAAPAVCQDPSCSDGVQNGGETDVDCGSVCSLSGELCGDDQACFTDADCTIPYSCLAGVCTYDVCLAQTQIPVNECQELVDLYNATGGGTTWTNDWPEVATAPPVGTRPTPCSWYGVTCTGANVGGIDLRNNNLSGSLPGSWLSTGMPVLKDLRLGTNPLVGPLPASVGTVTSLQALWIGNGTNWGTLPDLSGLTNLQAFVAGNSGIGGPGSTLPAWLGSLTSLSLLDVRDNAIEGTIPAGIGNLPALTQLWLRNNALTGTIPSTFPALGDTVTVFHINDNQLSGDVPFDETDFVNFAPPVDNTKRNLFSMYNNGCLRATSNAQGAWLDELDPAPASWNNGCTTYCERQNELLVSECLALRDLYVNTGGTAWTDNTSWPNFANEPLAASDPGPEPPCTWFGVNCTDLAGQMHVTRLSMGTSIFGGSGNAMKGSLPETLGDLTELTFIGMRYNPNLSGPLPDRLRELTKLQSVYMLGCGLTGLGPLSDSAAALAAPYDLSALQTLELRNNPLADTFPTRIASHDGLVSVDLGNTSLTGTVPNLAMMSSLRKMYLNNNALSGALPDVASAANPFALNFSFNQFTGNIPASWGALTGLIELRFHSNKLHGQLPTYLDELSLTDPNLFGARDNLCFYPADAALDNWLRTTPGMDPAYDNGCTAQCSDVIQNGDETDVDCGGACAYQLGQGCQPTQGCGSDPDCDAATAPAGCQAGVCTECLTDAECNGHPNGPVCDTASNTCTPLYMTTNAYAPDPDLANASHTITGTTNAGSGATFTIPITVDGMAAPDCTAVTHDPAAGTWACTFATDHTQAAAGPVQVKVGGFVAYNGASASTTPFETFFTIQQCINDDTHCGSVDANESACEGGTTCNPLGYSGTTLNDAVFTSSETIGVSGGSTNASDGATVRVAVHDGTTETTCANTITSANSFTATCDLAPLALPPGGYELVVYVNNGYEQVSERLTFSVVECKSATDCTDDGLACTTTACSASNTCVNNPPALNSGECVIGGACYTDGQNGASTGPWDHYNHCDSSVSTTAWTTDPSVCAQSPVDDSIGNDFREWIDTNYSLPDACSDADTLTDITADWTFIGTGTNSLFSDTPYRGAAYYSAAAAGGDYAMLTRPVPAGNQYLHTRFYMRHPSTSTVEGFDVAFFELLGSDFALASIEPSTDVIWLYDGSAGGPSQWYSTGVSFPRDTWACVQVDVDLTSGKISLSLGGAQIGTHSTPLDPTDQSIGTDNAIGSTSKNPARIDFDEMVTITDNLAASIPCDP